MTDKTEIQILKEKADSLEIQYPGNISLAKLKELLFDGDVTEPEAPVVKQDTSEPRQGTPKEVAKDKAKLRAQVIAQKRKEANRLVRVMITCMNPDKGEHPGEIFTVANSIVGTIRKFVPFQSDQPFHVPQMILNIMRERKCQIFVNKRLSNGQVVKKGKLINEFAIEVLDKISKEELQTIKTKQLAQDSISD
ncbi:MAG: hypothetical protein HRU18_02925 [Pseudoalteromonas sp.]|uniref:hypothetical protein n=1 Tax=Pseudoalteromonas sp. TaxID=53249 RepID=UPI001D5F8F2C|nr:hypothetical protein [Pseudoalteromonas sp.]NRA77138.1 hypothetical protein [Pseudoalteromonas sp.]